MTQVLAVIAARGGSKSFPQKNVADFAGRPLIAWTIGAALGARRVARTIVTTDDPEIADVARRFGAEVPFMRPRDLAADDTPGMAPVLHAVRWMDTHEGYTPDVIVNLQPTSPLRTSADVDAALDLLESAAADAVVSVSEAGQHPYWMKTIDPDGWMHDFIEQREPIGLRQRLPPVFALNGAIYAAHRRILLERETWYTDRTAAYVMPSERSVDIDTALDLRVAELLRTGGRP